MGLQHRSTVSFILKALGGILLLSSGACSDPPLAPEDQLALQTESAHFTYHWAPGDEPVDTAWQERHLAWSSSKLEVQPSKPIEYRKYRDPAHLDAATGHDRGTGFAEPESYRFHSVWTRDRHEYIHVLFNAAYGTPPPLFSEGVAVAHHGASLSGAFDGNPIWNEESVHGIALRLLNAGELPPAGRLASSDGFYDYPGDLTYPVAGSFVRHLIDTRGVGLFKAFVQRTDGPGDSLDQVRQDLQAVYGASLQELWDEWLAFLQASAVGDGSTRGIAP